MLHILSSTNLLLELEMTRFQHFYFFLTMGDGSPKTSAPTSKLEPQILEAVLKRELKGTSIKSINRIILKFPKIDESLRKCKVIFEQFGTYIVRNSITLYIGKIKMISLFVVIFFPCR